MLEYLFERYLPIAIHVLELMGIIILIIGAINAFYHYINTAITKKPYPLEYKFADSLVKSLEFKLAAEILKTVIVHSMEEIIMIGSIFIIRILMTFVLEKEMKMSNKKEKDYKAKNS